MPLCIERTNKRYEDENGIESRKKTVYKQSGASPSDETNTKEKIEQAIH